MIEQGGDGVVTRTQRSWRKWVRTAAGLILQTRPFGPILRFDNEPAAAQLLVSLFMEFKAGQAASIDTTTANGRLMFAFFAALAEFERELIVERTMAGLAAARARGRNGGRPFQMAGARLRLAQAAMGKPETNIADLCAEHGVTRQTLYRHVAPDGQLRPDGSKFLSRR